MAEHEREQEPDQGRGPESEEKQPQAEEEVPGVRGGAPAPVEEPASQPRPDLGTWGGEGGAGSYPGAPAFTRPPEEEPGEVPEAGQPPREPGEDLKARQPPRTP